MNLSYLIKSIRHDILPSLVLILDSVAFVQKKVIKWPEKSITAYTMCKRRSVPNFFKGPNIITEQWTHIF